MKLELEKYSMNAKGAIEGTIVLRNDDSENIYEDEIKLSNQRQRQRFAADLETKYPQLRGRDLEAQLLRLLWNAKDELAQSAEESTNGHKPQRTPQADRLVQLAEEADITLFSTPTRVGYAAVPVDNHRETLRLRSTEFKQWLSRQLYTLEGKAPNSDSLNTALTVLEGKATFEGPTYDLGNRIAEQEGIIYYDLADPAWHAVEITPEGFRTVPAPILFRRFSHQAAQNAPQEPGNADLILDYINIRDPEEQKLFLIYLVGLFIPNIGHPIAHFHGGQGAAKTTTTKLIGSLVDPSFEPVLTMPTNDRELARQLNQHAFAAFDNLSGLQDWQSNILCSATTGTGFSTRQLYTDEESVIFALKRAISLNGINIVASKPDLLDRSIIFGLDRLSSSERRDEATLWGDFNADKPHILCGIFEILSAARAIYPQVQKSVKSLPRMADFALWGCAMADVMGYGHDWFLEAYEENRRKQNAELLSSNPVSLALQSLMAPKDMWEGTPAELLADLEGEAFTLKVSTNNKSWPKAPHVLSRRLNELQANLAEAGLEVQTGQRRISRNPERRIKIIKHTPPKDAGKSVYTGDSVYTASEPRSEGVGATVDATTSVDATDVDATDDVDATKSVASTRAQLQDHACVDAVDSVDGKLTTFWKGGQ